MPGPVSSIFHSLRVFLANQDLTDAQGGPPTDRLLGGPRGRPDGGPDGCLTSAQNEPAAGGPDELDAESPTGQRDGRRDGQRERQLRGATTGHDAGGPGVQPGEGPRSAPQERLDTHTAEPPASRPMQNVQVRGHHPSRCVISLTADPGQGTADNAPADPSCGVDVQTITQLTTGQCHRILQTRCPACFGGTRFGRTFNQLSCRSYIPR